eukprot:TRINITY_DN93660_c0_g1_i1.p1 TRINITY_DN93660_c0_g1~~TRINITY_DN93660_c0_g1_i1.p1  ORF type:complete len:343 (+),score=65.43 TRINITY_DN93660_c0_g1_i1:132-1031(+)
MAEAHDIEAQQAIVSAPDEAVANFTPEEAVATFVPEEAVATSAQEAVETDDGEVPLAPAPQGKRAPLLTTDMVYETADLLQTVYANFLADHVRMKAAAFLNSTDPITSAVLVADPIAQLCSKLGCKKEEVEQDVHAIYKKTRVFASGLTALAVQTSGRIQEHMADWTHVAVDHFERVMPKYEGLIPRTTGNLTLFVMYLIAVLCVLLRAASLALRLALFVLCCCRRSREAAKPPRLYSQQVPDIRRPAWLPLERAPSSAAARPRAGTTAELTQQQRPVECCLFDTLPNPVSEFEKWFNG